MKVKPTFSGNWYGIQMNEGVAVEIPERLQAKVKQRPDLFRATRIKKAAAYDQDQD